jgi:2-succinyl-5-enolpyruvyl-6-hydroxy-3-cyclohexene-1-carboxylate synthase
VRDLDLSSDRAASVAVVANRGLAGIDGCVSTAVGIALAGTAPTYALLGDLTFLHDSGGLLIGPHEPSPDLTLVVVNDDGGGIFTLLEPGEPERADDFERVFGTPTGTDLAALCAAHGVAHQRLTDRLALAEAVGRPPKGLRVLEVPVDRSGHRAAHAHLRRLAADALGAG